MKLRGFREEGALAYCNRGACYFDKGAYDQALADLNRAIRINPELGIAYHNRGLVYKKQARAREASADAAKANELAMNTHTLGRLRNPLPSRHAST